MVQPRTQPTTLLRGTLVLAPFALLAAPLALTFLVPGSSSSTACALFGFIAFEFSCGLYAPAMSAVKGSLVPERLRSTIYSTFRVPMNAVVLLVLLSGSPPRDALLSCVVLLVAA